MLFIGSDCLNENSRPPPLALALKANKDSVAAVGWVTVRPGRFGFTFTFIVMPKSSVTFLHIFPYFKS